MKIRAGLSVASLLLIGGTVHAGDCAVDPDVLVRAREQVSNSQSGSARDRLRESVAACPSYDAYEAMGEILGHSKNRRDWSVAADAFVKADSLAMSAKARAETLFQYASLLNDDNDPQNAYALIKRAHVLDPKRKDVAELSAIIERQVRTPQKQQLVRSFGLSVYKPLKRSSSLGGGVGAISGAEHNQSNIPINFEFNSVEVNAQTRDNVVKLAEALDDPALKGKRFLFVGHTDARGDELYNTALSKRRADAMRSAVVELRPELASRIDVDGRGSSEPLDPGTDLNAMVRNRRLQVLEK